MVEVTKYCPTCERLCACRVVSHQAICLTCNTVVGYEPRTLGQIQEDNVKLEQLFRSAKRGGETPQ